MNRGGYRNEQAADGYNDMAAGKESGSIEYQAKAQLTLRSVKGHGSVIEVHAPKIKRGAEDADGLRFYLRFDRVRHVLSECPAPDMPNEERERESRGQAKTVRRVRADAKILADIILANQGIGERDLRAKLRRAGHAWGRDRLDAAKVHLGRRLENRGTHARDVRWHLVGEVSNEDE
jgi:hypothetical protein